MFRFLTTSRAREEADTQHAAPIAFWETGGRGSCQAANLFDLPFFLQTNGANRNRPLTRCRSQNMRGSDGTSPSLLGANHNSGRARLRPSRKPV